MTKQDTPAVLATDLDGTLIPLTGQPANETDLALLADGLRRRGAEVLFVTGRHRASVEEALGTHRLPTPDGLICDVGTSIHLRDASQQLQPVEAYAAHLSRMTVGLPIDELRRQLSSIAGLRLQAPEKQGAFKLSYYVDSPRLPGAVEEIERRLRDGNAPYGVISSLDPESGEGLIDLLPQGVSKAYALDWWVEFTGRDRGEIVYAGDSGNDWAPLVAGYRAIVVGNAPRALARRVYEAHQSRGWESRRLCLARGAATSGVLEGCRWFELIDPPPVPSDRFGATPVSCNRTHFRCWAPHRQEVAVHWRSGERTGDAALRRDSDGCFSGLVEGVGPGDLYQYRLDHHVLRPDPAARRQPFGVHRESEVVDPDAFPWTDDGWRGVAKRDLVIYELHLGAFTSKGTFLAAISRLDELVSLGVTTVELMPVAECPGRWNWGYDGVGLFAVRHTYGTPDEFKSLVDACHRRGLAVVLDVVYNHLGPEGNYLGEFGPYFSEKHHTPWGPAFDFDGPAAPVVRKYIVDNALYWIEEFHLDGLRLDAVHYMFDDSSPSILETLRDATAEAERRLRRPLHLIAESNVYDHELLHSRSNGKSYDAIWSDCLMHSIYSHGVPNVRLTPRDYRGAADVVEALTHGYVFTGPALARAESAERELRHAGCRQYFESLIVALQTHDAVGNHPHGKRIQHLTSVEFQRAAAALVLLHPGIPMIFMGEEWATPAPFPFFADFGDPQLRSVVDRGRRLESPRHQWKGAVLPSDPAAFLTSKCDSRRQGDLVTFHWYRELLQLRRRGLDEGWLAAERINSVTHDAAAGLFLLEYAAGNRRIQLGIRLRAVDGPDQPIRWPCLGDVLLDSHGSAGVGAAQGALTLQANHAVVIETGAPS